MNVKVKEYKHKQEKLNTYLKRNYVNKEKSYWENKNKGTKKTGQTKETDQRKWIKENIGKKGREKEHRQDDKGKRDQGIGLKTEW